MLNEIKYDVTYRSDRQDIVQDFYEPCLFRSILYRRAAGYFTTNGISSIASGIAALAVSGGKIRLVASPALSEEDALALKQGYADKDRLKEICGREFRDIRDEILRDRLSSVSWLIAKGMLDVKLALRVSDGQVKRGIYHEKMGIFEDKLGNQVAFSGSSNETKGGLVDNFETLDVYCSWDDPQGRVRRKFYDFEELWINQTPGLDVIEFSAVTEEILAAYRGKQEPDWEKMLSPALRKKTVDVPSKWRHQDLAVAAFLKSERGILEMATGTGKTRTALRVCETLLRRGDIDTIIVAADGVDLLDQWRGQLVDLTAKVNRRFALHRHYSTYHERDRFVLSPKDSIFLASRSALASALRALDAKAAARTIVIHDEAHRVGSRGNQGSLNGTSESIRFRLGLSATPEREYDDEGSRFVEQHIGNVIFQFGLEEAIEAGILAPFNYYPLGYVLNADDRRRMKVVFGRRTQRAKAGNPMSDEEFWRELARIHKTSHAKLPIFDAFINEHRELLENTIIFVETKEYGDEVLKIVHKYRHDFHTYYGEEDSSVLRQFAKGDISCLITCHRLSEGIDIRSLETVILFASARGKLETIQRIGRCLRADPNNPEKCANVVDFIRDVVPDEHEPEADLERSAWLTHLSSVRPKV